MSATITAPRGKTRRTKVTKSAYWVASDNGGEGNWRYLPVDRCHNQTVTSEDEDGNPTRPVDLYVHKGYLPVEYVQDEKALAKLPVNWRDVANKGAEPEFAKPEPEPALTGADAHNQALSGFGA